MDLFDVRTTRTDDAPGASPLAARRVTLDDRRLAQLAAVVETSSEALLSVAPDGAILTWNPAAARLFGYTEAEAVGRNIAMISPDGEFDSGRITAIVLGEGRVLRFHADRLRKDGTRVPVSINAAPMRNEAGEIIGVSTVIRDRTLAVRAAERQKLLVRELAHRGKNLLAIIQSIARHSLAASDCSGPARERFIARVAGLARTFQTLNAEGFEGARLSELVRLELETWPTRSRADGPDILLRASEAQTFGLMLHELAINAATHGALSVETGEVEARWRLDDGPDAGAGETRFIFEWREIGGPPVEQPAASGFGTTLIRDVVSQSFGAEPVIEFAREGLRYSFEAELSRLGRRLEASPLRARIRSARMRAFHDAWWRENPEPPPIEDLDREIRKNPSQFTIAAIDSSVVPERLRILSWASATVDPARRFDVTLGDRSGRDIPGSLEATYRRCARSREPMYEFSEPVPGSREQPLLERLFVPCSQDGKTITHVVGMSVYDTPG